MAEENHDYLSGFIKEHIFCLKSLATKYSGGKPGLRDELYETALLNLMEEYRKGSIDISRKGSKTFVWIKVRGWILNALKKWSKERKREPNFGIFENEADEDDGLTVEERLSPSDLRQTESSIVHHDLIQAIDEYLNTLTAADRLLMVSRYVDGLGLEEIGELLGVSGQAVWRREKELKNTMSSFLEQRGWTITDIREVL